MAGVGDKILLTSKDEWRKLFVDVNSVLIVISDDGFGVYASQENDLSKTVYISNGSYKEATLVHIGGE